MLGCLSVYASMQVAPGRCDAMLLASSAELVDELDVDSASYPSRLKLHRNSTRLYIDELTVTVASGIISTPCSSIRSCLVVVRVALTETCSGDSLSTNPAVLPR